MNYLDTGTGLVAQASGDVKANFIKKTYLHLAGAIALFTLVETIFIKIGLGDLALELLAYLLSITKYAWIGVLILFGMVSSMVHKWAHSSISREMQYIALFCGIVLEVIFFLPMIMMAVNFSSTGYDSPNILLNAAIVTLSLVAGLTAVVFITGKDFSFLKTGLIMGGFIAFGLIFASVSFDFNLGLVFSGAMIIFSSAAILYETSKIMLHYHEDQYVGASLSLLSSVGMLFWYVLSYMMNFASGD